MAIPSAIWEKLDPEELAAEGLAVVPLDFLSDEQLKRVIEWTRAQASAHVAEADALDAFAVSRKAH